MDGERHAAAGEDGARQEGSRTVPPDAVEDELDEASDESFPASDSPAWSRGASIGDARDGGRRREVDGASHGSGEDVPG